MNFGSKLKALRKSQKLTQQQLADRIGVAKPVVSYYESGNRYPSYDVLVRIAHIYDHSFPLRFKAQNSMKLNCH